MSTVPANAYSDNEQVQNTEVSETSADGAAQENTNKATKPQFCAECSGKSTRGRGYNHKLSCSKNPANCKYKPVNAATCSECGGIRRGRGWSHNDGCKNDKRAKPVDKSV